MLSHKRITELHQDALDRIGDTLIQLQDESMAVVEFGIEALDLLMERGATISMQSNKWHLFAASGDGLAEGASLVELIGRVGELK